MNIIIVLGLPGAGKTSQSLLLGKHYNYIHVSTGDIIREEIENKTELGLKYSDLIAMGEFVSDEIIMEFIENRIVAGCEKPGFVFDGFPRTLPQAILFDKLADKLGLTSLQFIMLNVTENEAVRRLLKRAETSGRKDDNLATINNRMDLYNERTEAVVEYYAESGRLSITDGELAIEQVFRNINKIITA